MKQFGELREKRISACKTMLKELTEGWVRYSDLRYQKSAGFKKKEVIEMLERWGVIQVKIFPSRVSWSMPHKRVRIVDPNPLLTVYSNA